MPVLCVCTRKDLGIKELLDLITTCGLSPADIHRFGTRGDESDAAEEEILPAESGTLVAQVFKTVNDQFMGKLSYLRILSGRLATDTTIVNLRSGKTTKTGHIYVMQGKQQEEVHEAIAGDIVAIAKFDDLHVSDTISNVGGNTVVSQLRVKPIKFPIPMVPRAVQPKARDDEAKISAGLAKIADEDPTFSIRRDAQTHELVISGMSDLHLDVIQQRLKHRHKLEMNTHVPAGRLSGDDLRRSRSQPSAQETNRRPWPVRRGASARPSPRARQGLQLCRRRQGRHDPQSVHPGLRKGCPRADGEGCDLGQPGRRYRGRGLFRQRPSRR